MKNIRLLILAIIVVYTSCVYSQDIDFNKLYSEKLSTAIEYDSEQFSEIEEYVNRIKSRVLAKDRYETWEEYGQRKENEKKKQAEEIFLYLKDKPKFYIITARPTVKYYPEKGEVLVQANRDQPYIKMYLKLDVMNYYNYSRVHVDDSQGYRLSAQFSFSSSRARELDIERNTGVIKFLVCLNFEIDNAITFIPYARWEVNNQLIKDWAWEMK